MHRRFIPSCKMKPNYLEHCHFAQVNNFVNLIQNIGLQDVKKKKCIFSKHFNDITFVNCKCNDQHLLTMLIKKKKKEDSCEL